MDTGMLAKLALLLQGGNKFGGQTYGGAKMGGNTYGGNTFGASSPQVATARAAPPALPAYQPTGMSLPDMQAYMQKQGQPPGVLPQMPAGATPNTPPPAMPPMADPNAAASAVQATTSPTAVPPMPPPTPIGAAPGMGGQDQGMVAQILAALKARDPHLPPQMAMGQSTT